MKTKDIVALAKKSAPAVLPAAAGVASVIVARRFTPKSLVAFQQKYKMGTLGTDLVGAALGAALVYTATKGTKAKKTGAGIATMIAAGVFSVGPMLAPRIQKVIGGGAALSLPAGGAALSLPAYEGDAPQLDYQRPMVTMGGTTQFGRQLA